MKRQIVAGAIFMFLFPAIGLGTLETQIWYDAEEITPVSGDTPARWQYAYGVKNIDLSVPIEEFTIWFDFDSYDNLSIETPDPPASDWDEIVVQPEPVLSDNGYYDVLAVMGIGINLGETVSGFSVSFDWLGIGEPGSQLYEIIDPDTFETLDSGQTIPEPSTLLMIGLGAVILRRKRRSDITH